MSSSEHECAVRRVGQVLRDKYRLDSVLGIGGMASVYAATHCRNGRRFAIKILHAALAKDDEARQRFVQEGYVANLVGHSGAVAVIDDDVDDDGAPFLVMELLEGQSLKDLVDAGRPLTLAAVVDIADQVLSVLAVAHERGVVHRDIKPENLFVTRDGAVKILDFGIAKVRDAPWSGKTRPGSVMGTLGFMPAEQAMGQDIDARADVWAVGATLFVLLSGVHVHTGSNTSALLVSAASVPARAVREVAPGVPPSIAAVIDRALAFDRDQRWSNAAEMRAALRHAVRGWRAGHAITSLTRSTKAFWRGVVRLSLAALAWSAALARAVSRHALHYRSPARRIVRRLLYLTLQALVALWMLWLGYRGAERLDGPKVKARAPRAARVIVVPALPERPRGAVVPSDPSARESRSGEPGPKVQLQAIVFQQPVLPTIDAASTADAGVAITSTLELAQASQLDVARDSESEAVPSSQASSPAWKPHQANTDLYLFASLSTPPAAVVRAFYRSPCTRGVKSAAMWMTGTAYVYIVPAADVCGPLLEYTLVAYDEARQVLWTKGTAEYPMALPIQGWTSTSDLRTMQGAMQL